MYFVFGPAGPGSDPSPVLHPSGHPEHPNAPAQLQPADLGQAGALRGRAERQMSLNMTQIRQQWSRDFFFPPAKGDEYNYSPWSIKERHIRRSRVGQGFPPQVSFI